MSDIGDRVRELREEQGLSVSELARRSDLTPTGVGLIEKGQRTPSSVTVEKLARGLNVDPGDLFEAPKAEGPQKSARLLAHLRALDADTKAKARGLLKHVWLNPNAPADSSEFEATMNKYNEVFDALDPGPDHTFIDRLEPFELMDAIFSFAFEANQDELTAVLVDEETGAVDEGMVVALMGYINDRARRREMSAQSAQERIATVQRAVAG